MTGVQTCALPICIPHEEETWENTAGPSLRHLSRRKRLYTAGVAIISILDNGTEDHQTSTKACENLWDLEEEMNRSSTPPEPPHLVVGIVLSSRMKLTTRRHHCSPPPHRFAGSDELRHHLGFVEGGKTKRMAQVWSHLVAGVERYRRSKLSRRRRC